MRAITGQLISRSCYPERVRIGILALLVGRLAGRRREADWKGLVSGGLVRSARLPLPSNPLPAFMWAP